jgi:cell division protein FtsN
VEKKMNQLRALISISCLLFILNCRTTPPLQFQENKQEQPALIVVGSKSNAINTEHVDINEELVLLKEKDDKQKIKQNSDVIESSSDKDYKNIVQARSDKKFENSNKFINKLKVDSQYTSRTIYTIQTGSFLKVERAQKQFDSMLQILNGKEFSFLRIEKIGKYYSVRLGRFDNYNNTKKFLQEIKSQLSEAVILKVHIKNERLVRLYE